MESNRMKRFSRLVLMVLAPALVVGCQSLGGFADVPPMGFGTTGVSEDNPVFVPLGPKEYGRVFETALKVLGDYGFEIAPGDAKRYAGTIETLPHIAPGLGLFLSPGSPDFQERLLASAQTYRHRGIVKLQPVINGGFFVEFIVIKELEDNPKPMRSTVGGAVFRSEATAARPTEVIDATFFQNRWIYKGRDSALEQDLIRRFRLGL